MLDLPLIMVAPNDVATFADPLINPQGRLSFDWMLCAIAPPETDCRLKAIELRGKARIGFENALWNRDGTLAQRNAERVRKLVAYPGA